MQLYKFLKSLILELNNKPNKLLIPENSEAVFITSLEAYAILQIITPKHLSRFTVRLPREHFKDLDPVKESHSVYIQDLKDPEHVISEDPRNSVTAQVIQPFRKKAIPALNLNSWYVVTGFEYPLLRFDGYDNGLYLATVQSKENKKLIKINIPEDVLVKYPIRLATTKERYGEI